MDYVRVTSEADLAAALRQDGAALLAGGTDLLVKMRAGTLRPRLLVDASRIESLQSISQGSDGFRIGSGVRIADILASRAVAESYPLLALALQSLGSVQIRNRATLGGNLANASPAADAVLALLAYEAELDLHSEAGTRTLAVSEFLRAPGRTALTPGEYVRSVTLPWPRPDWVPFFHKVGRRRALTIAIVSVGGLVARHDGVVADLRVVAGSVAPTSLRLRAVEKLAVGRRVDEALVAQVRTVARQTISPIGDVRASAEYRRDVTGELVARLLSQA